MFLLVILSSFNFIDKILYLEKKLNSAKIHVILAKFGQYSKNLANFRQSGQKGFSHMNGLKLINCSRLSPEDMIYGLTSEEEVYIGLRSGKVLRPFWIEGSGVIPWIMSLQLSLLQLMNLSLLSMILLEIWIQQWLVECMQICSC